MKECQCKGTNYFGMPSLELLSESATDSNEDESKMYYSF